MSITYDANTITPGGSEYPFTQAFFNHLNASLLHSQRMGELRNQPRVILLSGCQPIVKSGNQSVAETQLAGSALLGTKDGFAYANGRIFRVEQPASTASSMQAEWRLVDANPVTRNPLLFSDGAAKSPHLEKVLQLTDSTVGQFSGLGRWEQTTRYSYVMRPVGEITMFAGQLNDIPNGWALCDGSTFNNYQTPDLRGKFVVGQNGGVDYAVGDTGGQDSFQIGKQQLPDLDSISSSGLYFDRNSDGSTDLAVTTINQVNISNSGDPIDNRPPYYALAYIVRVPEYTPTP